MCTEQASASAEVHCGGWTGTGEVDPCLQDSQRLGLSKERDGTAVQHRAV